MEGNNKEIRCVKCRKLLAKGTINDGAIEIACKCGVINTVAVAPKPTPDPTILGTFDIAYMNA